ncbi:hypothetical protein [Novosphingobium olei]|uniref:VanZ like protein n=1 Tax=Novosphingobium olei TaxID=2728851 RepID=A0A7Y0BT80_9SPHN|nr:hypothetical protein [Novosphingobium olei]NML96177.1 hypothetical protein [Novosphingobium olei]
MNFVTAIHFAKDSIAQNLGVSHQVLHIHAGLAIYIAAQLALGTRRASLAALCVVFGAEFANELVDFLFHGQLLVSDTIQDIVATVFWPLVIYAVGTVRRKQWRREVARRRHFSAMLARLADGSEQVHRPTLG